MAGDVGATAFFYTSDARLKANLQPTKGLDIIQGLHGVAFTWKDSGQPSAGLTAQDVEQVLPEAVSTDASTGLKSLNYGALTAPIVESIKELKTSGDDTSKRLTELEAEVAALKRQLGERDAQE